MNTEIDYTFNMDEYQKNYNFVRKENFKNYKKCHNEQLKEKMLLYWKKKNNERQNILYLKTYCPCGGSYTYRHKNEHFRTKKHKNYLELNLNAI